MRLTTKGRVGVIAMIDLALRATRNPVPLAAISTRHRISISYLEQMFSDLRRNGLVLSTRGPGGGYSLSRPSSAISIGEIVRAADKRATEPLNDEATGPGSQRCATPELWASVTECAMAYLDSVSLESVVRDAVLQGDALLAVEPPARKRLLVPGRRPSPLPKAPNSVFALARFKGAT